MTERKNYTVQFYQYEELLAEENGDEWPQAYVLVAHATIPAKGPLDAADEFTKLTHDQLPDRGPWWIDGQVTVRSRMATLPVPQVRGRDTLAIGHDSMVRLLPIAHADQAGAEFALGLSDPLPESSSVFTVHQEEQHLEAERRRLLKHYEYRSTQAETATEQALGALLDACGELLAAVLRDKGVPPGLLELRHPLRVRLVDLLRTTSELVATLPCPNLRPGDCQDEIRYIAWRAGVEGDLVKRNSFSLSSPIRRVPIYTDPPRELDMPLAQPVADLEA